MKRSERIHLIINQALNPLKLEVIDESSLHAGHSGAREGGYSGSSFGVRSVVIPLR